MAYALLVTFFLAGMGPGGANSHSATLSPTDIRVEAVVKRPFSSKPSETREGKPCPMTSTQSTQRQQYRCTWIVAVELADATIQAHQYRLKQFVRWCNDDSLDNLNDLSGRDLH